jgi:pimeloyl-ACP methyl ester carboxylesterase
LDRCSEYSQGNCCRSLHGWSDNPEDPKILELSSDEELFHDAAELVTAWSFSEGADERLQELGLERLKETKAEVTNSDFHACNDFDIMEELSHIKVPTLVICGEEDRMTPVRHR